MKYKDIILVSLLTLSAPVIAQQNTSVKAATSKAEFCEKSKDLTYFKSLLYNSENHISFGNHGGLADGGVCWWHSMLLRSATYLTVYRPELPKPSSSEVEQILSWITAARGIVEIPGYKNFSEFTRANYQLVQRYLEQGQIMDGGFGFGWVRGLSGDYEVAPSKLKEMMDETYALMKESKRVVYQKLQIQGIVSHAWLLVDMEQNADGYLLSVVDSNYSGSVVQRQYRNGSKNLSAYSSVPYTSRNSIDFKGYDYALKMYCKYGKSAADLDRSSGDNLY
ncbi:MAG: hypothetical protein AAGB31_13955 [Bdellovibrio sp.]